MTAAIIAVSILAALWSLLWLFFVLQPNLVFINAENFIGTLLNYRAVWIRGRYGGGKTSLAMFIALEIGRRGSVSKLLANIDTALREYPPVIPVKDAVIVMDEAVFYLETWRDVKAYAAFLRKNNLFMLMPSVYAVHKRLRPLECYRVFNAMVVGLPFWLYRYKIESPDSKPDYGYFALVRPLRIFKYFNTASNPVDDGGVLSSVTESFRLAYEAERARIKTERGVIFDDHSQLGRRYSGEDGDDYSEGYEAAVITEDAFEQQAANIEREYKARKR